MDRLRDFLVEDRQLISHKKVIILKPSQEK